MFSRNAMLLAKSGSSLFIFLRFWLRLFWPWLQTTFLMMGVGAIIALFLLFQSVWAWSAAHHCCWRIRLNPRHLKSRASSVLQFSWRKTYLSKKEEKHPVLLWNLVEAGNPHQISQFFFAQTCWAPYCSKKMKTHPARQLGMCRHAKFNIVGKGLVKPQASTRWYEMTGCFNISCCSVAGNAILGLFRAATLLCLFFLIWLLCLGRNLGQINCDQLICQLR